MKIFYLKFVESQVFKPEGKGKRGGHFLSPQVSDTSFTGQCWTYWLHILPGSMRSRLSSNLHSDRDRGRDTVLSKPPQKFWDWIQSSGMSPNYQGLDTVCPPRRQSTRVSLFFLAQGSSLGEAVSHWGGVPPSYSACLHGGHVTTGRFSVNPWGKLNLGSNLNFEWSFLPCEGSV